MLEVKNLEKSFGGLKAVDNLSFSIEKDMIYGLIGPNGAGKTTVFNCLSRFYKPDDGEVIFSPASDKKYNILNYKIHDIITLGLARTFQNVELFSNLSVLDNLLVGKHWQITSNFMSEGLRLPFTKKEEKIAKNKALEILDFLGIKGRENMMASAQPYGIQKMIELGRILMADPVMIMLDEPAAGMNSSETNKLAELIQRIRDELDITVFLVEHDMQLVMKICDRICAINFGKKIGEGTPKEIQNDPQVQEAYLGKEAEKYA